MPGIGIYLLMLAAVGPSDGLMPLPAGAVKWHPGHYATLMSYQKRDRSPAEWGRLLQELARHPNLRGVQIRYFWSELEHNEGDYDFSTIERDIAALAKHDKRLVILLQTKSFTPHFMPVPDYLLTERFQGGVFPIHLWTQKKNDKRPGGANIKLWNTEVRDRLIALISALGQRFNHHPYLEAIALTETAPGQSPEIHQGNRMTAFYDNLLQVDRALRSHFPNTVTLQFVNFPRKMIPKLVTGLAQAGVGLGGPDVFLDEPSLRKGVYRYYSQLADRLPLGPSVQRLNYLRHRARGPHNPPTTKQLFRFARDELKANYLFWTRVFSPPERPYQQFLQLLNRPELRDDAAGGLHSACPSAYDRCVE